MSIRLSICIPTYNRAAFIGQALDSIIAQATDEVEIVVSDNASTDDTEALVRDYQTRFPRIRYHRNPENLGADRNFLKVMEIAQGEYGWLLGSDDALAAGAISAVLQRLGRADIYLTDLTHMSFEMNRVLAPHVRLHKVHDGHLWDCSLPEHLLGYFKSAATTGHIDALFCYISVLIVRREKWIAQQLLNEFIGSAWMHTVKIFQMMRAGARIEYIAQPLVKDRKGNDSFAASIGFTRRKLLDLDYPRVARGVFHDRPEILQQVTITVAKQTFNLQALLRDKLHSIEADGPQAAQKLADVYAAEFSGLPGYGLKMAIWHAVPFAVLNALRAGISDTAAFRTAVKNLARPR